ncbi:MAG: DEAD/DEAH box helicase [Cyanobacteria bacterium]|jgi:DEAD/DEAH box helicase domain-containing protein|nr:DEAD/DEAH box helicase [Cyanobacteria bacterium GSL.Bin21]
MIPSVVASEIRSSVEDFLKTEFRPTTPSMEHLLNRFLENPEAVFKGPYLSLSLPFQKGHFGRDYFPDVPMKFPPFRHQERAFERLSSPNYASTLVATGTGSGKTECFLMPILDHCYQSGGETGIKAILLYPMNALATDQAKRIAQLIWNNPNLKGKVTAGLFVGEKEQHPNAVMTSDGVITDKDILRQSPPDILLTNYKMLDYLLIRPLNQPIWSGNHPHTLRYLVVDEIHTFDGAQGTDLACLIRRLKGRLQIPRKHLACVGTSATLGGEEGKAEMLNYAQELFDESFDEEAVIEEDRLTASEFLADAFIDPSPLPSSHCTDDLNPSHYETVEAYIRAQYELWFDEELTAPFTETQWRVQLGERLTSLPIVHNLLKILDHHGAISLPDLWQELSRKMRMPKNAPPDYTQALLDSLIALCAVARRQEGDSIFPWVNIRLQFWMRELRRMVASVDATPQLTYADDLSANEQNRRLPVVHCRECGSTGWGGVRENHQSQQIKGNLKDFYLSFFSKRPATAIIFPTGGGVQTTHNQEQLHTQTFCQDCFTLGEKDHHRCLNCGSENLISVVEPNLIQATKTRTGGTQRSITRDCPFCGNKDGLAILGSRAASLASAAIGTLYTSTYNSDRKLIAFSDSVQDAAHRAGFFEARTFRTTLRTALRQYLERQGNGKTLNTILSDFKSYWRTQLGSDADYVATFMPTDLEWLAEWEDLQKTGDCSPQLKEFIDKRLDWELLTEIGLRSSFGASLERTGACAVQVDPSVLETATQELLWRLQNEVGALHHLDADTLKLFLLGFIHHLRVKGALLHPLTDQYIETEGSTYLLQKPPFMPAMGPASLNPSYLADKPGTNFEAILKKNNRSSWCSLHAYKHFFATGELTLGETQLPLIYDLILNTLEKHGILGRRYTPKNTTVWGLELKSLTADAKANYLECDRCSHGIVSSQNTLSLWENAPCLQSNCTGHYRPSQRKELDFYRQLYSRGELWRIFAREHTGLLDRSVREEIENQFIAAQQRHYPNLLSATSTLEMGINIGDLSSALLCSVPPTQANYQQRVGRAGRTDGNSFIVAIANGRPHDLFFWADPLTMISGGVDTPGFYLDASAILQRQLTAYCLDRWIATGIQPSQVPEQLKLVLDAVKQQQVNQFPYPWLHYIQEHHTSLLEEFFHLFPQQISNRTKAQLRTFIEKGEQDEGGLSWRILNRLQEVAEERQRLKSQIDTLRRKIKEKENAPKNKDHEEEIAELKQERSGFQQIIKNLNQKNTLNFFTDEGLIPNYAFPEAGVILKSIIWRRKQTTGNTQQGGLDTFSLEYERPSGAAIRELVPSSLFYAEGRQVKIDRVDLNLVNIEEWRFCRQCTYATRTLGEDVQQKTCPRCGDTMWRDQGRTRKMAKLRQVMATTRDRASRIRDDRDDRTPAFFTRKLFPDFDPRERGDGYLVQDETFPFGFELINRTTFREINFGEANPQADVVEIAGESQPRAGFKVCRSCGTVYKGANQKNHTSSCRYQGDDDETRFTDIIYLFREFESESIRLLMPIDTLTSPQKFHSFIAALQLGLKLYFKGQVNHLKTLISEEPQPNSPFRKPFLFLYDTVPGGTGYLRQLIKNPDQLFQVFQESLNVLRSCDCEDGCYKCLFAYRNSFERDYTSRSSAMDILNAIVNRQDKLVKEENNLSQIQLNTLFDSILEQRFIEALASYQYRGELVTFHSEIVNGKSGYFFKIGESSWNIEPQVELGEEEGISVSSKADFVFWPVRNAAQLRPIVVFTDGWTYHNDQISYDFLQRMAIVRSSQYYIWSLSWSDVEARLDVSNKNFFSNLLTLNCNQQFQQKKAALYQQYQCDSLRGIAEGNNFTNLMQFLANPDPQLWTTHALVRTLSQVKKNAISPTAWKQQVTHFIPPESLSAFMETPQYIGQISLPSFSGESLVESYIAIEQTKHKKKDSKGAFILTWLNDRAQVTDEELQKAWVGVLHQFNLLQFLDFSYFLTAKGLQKGVNFDLSFPDESDTVIEQDEKPLSDELAAAWTEIETVLFEAETKQLASFMKAQGWQLPEVGFELVNAVGTVLGEAEFAWPEKHLAMLSEVDQALQEEFEAQGWQVTTISHLLNQPELFQQYNMELNNG